MWFLVGLSLGALAGVLYAPQAGEKTREALLSKADAGRERVSRKVAEMREQSGSVREHVSSMAGSVTDRGKQAITRQIDQFQAAVEAGRQAYREAAGSERSGSSEDEASQL
ncbi:MAG: YtxH domain-containing protein [Terriglobales bacterium]